MTKILLVEDDNSLGESLKERLSKDYSVLWAQSAIEAKKLFTENKDINLLILDVGLPDGNGFDLAKDLRKFSKIPFIFLTAQADAESRLTGYQIGAEEYIPKPFHLKELLIRLKHVVELHSVSEIIDICGVQISFSDLNIRTEKNENLNLSSSEMKILELLIKQSPKVLDRDEIMNNVWGLDSQLSHRSIDNMIVKIRSRLSNAGKCIKTIRGRGYQWVQDE